MTISTPEHISFSALDCLEKWAEWAEARLKEKAREARPSEAGQNEHTHEVEGGISHA